MPARRSRPPTVHHQPVRMPALRIRAPRLRRELANDEPASDRVATRLGVYVFARSTRSNRSIDSLIHLMTLEGKIGSLSQIPGHWGPDRGGIPTLRITISCRGGSWIDSQFVGPDASRKLRTSPSGKADSTFRFSSRRCHTRAQGRFFSSPRRSEHLTRPCGGGRRASPLEPLRQHTTGLRPDGRHCP